MANTRPSYKDDFYEAINYDWLQTAVIPADKPATGGFLNLVDEIDQLLMKDFDKKAADLANVADPRLANYLKFYQMASDFAARDRLGADPAKGFLDQLEELDDFAKLQAALYPLSLKNTALPFQLYVSPDMKNAEMNTLYAAVPSLILPDRTYYEKDDEQTKTLLEAYRQMSEKILAAFGYPAEKAAATVQKALAFDRSIAPLVKSAEEASEYTKAYNPRDFAAFAAYSKFLDLGALTEKLLGQKPKTVIVEEPRFFEHFDELVNPETFGNLQAWLIVVNVNSLTGFLSEELRQIGGEFYRTLSGAKAAPSQKKSAFYLANSFYNHVVGDYYGKTYFGPAAKADVIQMVQAMIKVYEDRLQKKEWLKAETRQKAVKKLSTLMIKVGYPDEIDPLFSKLIVDPQKTLLANALYFTELNVRNHFSKWNQPVNKKRWAMSADTVNAYYSPTQNEIVFPAAILQAPFYDFKQSKSANYGGIGAVIAHEISHAFDNNGALFDEHGNLNNWWTKEDHQQFDKLAEKMVNEFDGLPFAGQKVNGRLTVSENIADAGGLSCALEAAKSEKDPELQSFFENWARIWRMKSSTAYQQMLLSFDVHAPNKLRANIQLENLADFFAVYEIAPGDGMYRAPAERVAIW